VFLGLSVKRDGRLTARSPLVSTAD